MEKSYGCFPLVEKISIYSSWKFQELKAEVRRRGLVTRGTKRSISIAQLEADDLERANEASVRSLDLNPVESEVSPEVLEQRTLVVQHRPGGALRLIFTMIHLLTFLMALIMFVQHRPGGALRLFASLNGVFLGIAVCMISWWIFSFEADF